MQERKGTWAHGRMECFNRGVWVVKPKDARYSLFEASHPSSTMGYKNVCLDCKKAYSLGTDFTKFRDQVCPECNTPMVFLSQRFRPPKQTDERKWRTVRFLVEHGFIYQPIFTNHGKDQVGYPDNLKDAEAFVHTYSEQASKRPWQGQFRGASETADE